MPSRTKTMLVAVKFRKKPVENMLPIVNWICPKTMPHTGNYVGWQCFSVRWYSCRVTWRVFCCCFVNHALTRTGFVGVRACVWVCHWRRLGLPTTCSFLPTIVSAWWPVARWSPPALPTNVGPWAERHYVLLLSDGQFTKRKTISFGACCFAVLIGNFEENGCSR